MSKNILYLEYKDLLEKFDNFKEYKEALRYYFYDRDSYLKAKKEHTKNSYQAYLSKFPEGLYVKNAHEIIQHEENLWKETQKRANQSHNDKEKITIYETYLSKSTLKTYKEFAKNKILELKNISFKDEENTLWQNIKNEASLPNEKAQKIKIYQKYLTQTKLYLYKEEMEKAIAKLKNEIAFEQEDLFWQQMNKEQTNKEQYIKNLQNYLSKTILGRYKNEAKDKIKRIQEEIAKEKKKHSLDVEFFKRGMFETFEEWKERVESINNVIIGEATLMEYDIEKNIFNLNYTFDENLSGMAGNAKFLMNSKLFIKIDRDKAKKLYEKNQKSKIIAKPIIKKENIYFYELYWREDKVYEEKEEKLWNEANKEQDDKKEYLKNLQTYLSKTVIGIYKNLAQQNIEHFMNLEKQKEKEKIEEEEIFWKTVKEKNTIKEYQRYLDNYPKEIYTKAARNMIQKIENARKRKLALIVAGVVAILFSYYKIDSYFLEKQLKPIVEWADKYQIPDYICPRDLRKLKKLKKLEVIDFSIESLPKEIGNLENLTKLSISVNKLTTLPKSIGNLKNLTELFIAENKLTTLPDSISNLKKLIGLSVYNNELSTFPKSINNLKNLRKLGISNNGLTTLPDWIGNLENLTYLSVNRNELTTLPESMSNLTKLELLDISNTNISNIPEFIKHIKGLEVIK